MSNTPYSNFDCTIAGIKSKQKNVMLMVKLMLAFTTIIGAFMIIVNQTTKPNQRHLNAEAAESTLLFFGRMQDGELRAFDVPSSANLNDIYQAIELAAGCIVGSLVFNGRRLPNDEQLAADVGICAESVIDVSPANDLQILNRAIENPNEYLWRHLLNMITPKKVRCALGDGDSYASFETAAKRLDKDVMTLAKECFRDKIFKIEQGKIVSIDTDNLWDSSGYHKPSINFDVLAQLTQLSNLKIFHSFVPGSEIDLSALGKMKQLKIVKLHFHNSAEFPDPEMRLFGNRVIIIPDMSECAQLEKIEVLNGGSGLLVVDCKGANVEKAKVIGNDGIVEVVWK